MNRTKMLLEMFELQRTLDTRILAPMGYDPLDANLLPSRVVAYLAEVGEFINERPDLFKYWKKNYEVDHDKALEELVDVWHFFLSIMLIAKQGTISESFIYQTQVYRPEIGSPQEALIALSELPYTYVGLQKLILIGETLGYPFDDVYNKYMHKNAVNHQRQEEGY